MASKSAQEIEEFHEYCIFGETDKLDKILEKDDLIEYGEQGLKEALLYAIKSGKKDIVKKLLNNEKFVAEFEKIEDAVQLSLDFAVGQKDEEEIIRDLSSKFDINKPNELGETKLHEAIVKGNIELVKTLIHHGAEFKPDQDGHSPLFLAAKHGHVDIVKLLLEKCSDDELLLTNYEEANPIHIAAEKSQLKILEILSKDPRFKEQFKAQDLYGRTPMDLAVQHKAKEAMLFLVRKKYFKSPSLSNFGKIDVNLNQSVLNDKIKKYLELHGRNASEIIDPGGNCNGWNFLFDIYLNAAEGEGGISYDVLKLIEIYTAESEDETFYDMLKLIESWDGTQEGLKSTKFPDSLKDKYKNLDDFFSQITNDLAIFQFDTDITKEMKLRWKQSSRIQQYELVRDPALNNQIKGLFHHSFPAMNQKQLAEILSFYAQWPGIHIDIGGGQHATSLHITPEGKFKYYDPNHKHKVRTFDSAQALANHIVKFKYKHLGKAKDDVFDIKFDAYKFYRKLEKTPDYEKPSIATLDFLTENALTELHLAVMENNYEKILDVLKTNPSLINQEDAHGYSPIYYAVGMRTLDERILEALLATPELNINQKNSHDSRTVLQHAIETDADKKTIKHLLDHREIDINVTDEDKLTPLMTALEREYDDEVILALLSRTDLKIDVEDVFNDTALVYAIEHEYDLNIIQVILKLSDKKYNVVGDEAPSIAAVERGDLEVIKALLFHGALFDEYVIERAKDEKVKEFLRQCMQGMDLHQAIRKNDLNEVRSIILKNPEVLNFEDQDGYTPCERALDIDGVDENILEEMLLNSQVDLQRQNKSGLPLLHFAVKNASAHELSILLKNKQLDFNQKDVLGRTALIFAIQNKVEIDKIYLLLNQEGIDVYQHDNANLTALMYAIEADLDTEVIDALLSKEHADNAVDEDGRTPLMIAIEVGANINTIKRLLAKEGMVNHADKTGKTALMIALDRNADKHVIDAILSTPGININKTDDRERSALMHAVLARTDIKIFKRLLKAADLDVNYKNSHDETALKYAIEKDEKDLIKLLLKHGAVLDADSMTYAQTSSMRELLTLWQKEYASAPQTDASQKRKSLVFAKVLESSQEALEVAVKKKQDNDIKTVKPTPSKS